MTLLLFATGKEAAETIQRFNAKPQNEEFFTSKDFSILITGMGEDAVKKTVPQYIHNHTQVINIGIAGSLKSHPLYSIHTIGSVFHEDELEPLEIAQNETKLLTVKKPLYNCLPNQDLVDMEGYTIAKIAKEYSIPCHMYKVVSDFCNKDSKEAIQKALAFASLIIADYISIDAMNVIQVHDFTYGKP